MKKERIHTTNSPDGCLLRVRDAEADDISSRLDKFEQYSIPGKEGEKHKYFPECTIKIVEEITGTEQAEKLLNW